MVIIALVIISTFSYPTHAEEEKRVLLISSYDPSFMTFFEQVNGVKSILDSENVILNVEFMDTKRFNNPENISMFYDMLKYKLSNSKRYDVIIVADDNALSFAMEHRLELFNNIPIVFLGINDIEYAKEVAQDPLITGIIEKVSMKETIELAIRLNPNAKNIIALVDDTKSGQGDLKTYYQLACEFNELHFSELSLKHMTFEEWSMSINALGTNDIILLLSAYQDKLGDTLSFNESLRLIKDSTQNPIYHLWYHGIGEGCFGGKVISHFEQGKVAAKIALDIINGADIKSIPIVPESPNAYVFDYNELKRLNIPLSYLPKDSLIINQNSFFETYNKAILFILSGLILVILVLVSIINNKKKTENKIKALFSNISDLIVVSDEKGYFNYTCSDSKLFFCIESEKLLGNHFSAFIYKEDKSKLIDAFDNVLNENTKTKIECRWNCNDEPMKIVEVTMINYLNYKKIQGILFTIHDITERRLYEKDLIEAKEKAEEASKVKTQFLANMSHEIRTPMNGFMGMLQLLNMTNLTDEQKEYIRVCKLSTGILLSVIEDILNYSKLEAGKLILEEMNFDLYKTLNDIYNLFETSAKGKGLDLSLHIHHNVPQYVIGDSFRLKQILSNLVGNAIKFTEKGKVEVVVKKLDAIEKGKIKIEFHIIDTGIGIPEEKMEGLFNSFSQADNSNTRKYGGTGLGLAICKSLVEKMNGIIGATSEEGLGSRFYFTCVFGESEKASIIEERDHQVHIIDNEDGFVNILLVEDDEVSAMVFREFVRKRGWKSTCAKNGFEAMDFYKQAQYDLVFMDIQLPGMDGYAITRKIRALEFKTGFRIPIIGLTANAMEGDREKCIEAGMNDYLPKPLNAMDLYRVVEYWLSKK